MYKTALALGAFFAGLGIAIGAFGAHALKPFLDANQSQVFETGVRYQMYHAFALLIAGVMHRSFPFRQIKIASVFFLIGILLFSGSLYAMTALKMSGAVGISELGLITPVGGVFFILGWIMMLWGVLKKKTATNHK